MVFLKNVFCLLCLTLPCLFAAPAHALPTQDYREIKWEELIPEDWDPKTILQSLFMTGIGNLDDFDPRAEKAYEEFIRQWEKAPINEKMLGSSIKLFGFIVPLDWANENELKEFLLVPFFGACIHVPPPPSNQIIHIVAGEKGKGLTSMQAVYVYGTLGAKPTGKDSDGSGYTMSLDRIENYTP